MLFPGLYFFPLYPMSYVVVSQTKQLLGESKMMMSDDLAEALSKTL